MARPRTHAKLDCSIPPEWDHQNAKGGHEDAHGNIGHSVGVGLAALEFEVTVVSRQQPCEPDEHFPEGWMDIEVKLALEVVRAELAKVCLVPDDDR